MGKAVLISIQPKWCERIATKRKTIELRKSKPNLKPPFKCYIYCTKFKYGEIACTPSLAEITKMAPSKTAKERYTSAMLQESLWNSGIKQNLHND